MSPDGNRSGVPGQRTDNTSWGQSFEDARQIDHDALPPLPASGEEEVFDSDSPYSEVDSDNWNAESDETGQKQASFLRGILERPERYIPIIVVPALFAIITSLLVLLSLSLHRTYISSAGFLPTLIVIVAIAVAQGVLVSYVADADNGMGALAMAGGFSLFFLIGTLAISGPVPTIVMFFIFVALFIVLIRLYFHPVAEGYIDIVYAFGKYSHILSPGPNMLMPWEKATHSLNVGEKQWVCPLQKVQLSRDEDVVLRATISYQVIPRDAYIAVTQVNQWEETLKELVISRIQSIATTFTPDDFIAWPQGLHSRPLTYDNAGDGEQRWERVNQYLHTIVGERAAHWGVKVNWIRIRDVSLAPHGATIVETDSVFDTPTTVLEHSALPADAAQKPPEAKAAGIKAPGSQPKEQKVNTNPGNARLAEETTQVVPAPPPEADQNNTPEPPKLPNEKALIEAYKAVQDGKITDSNTIRRIASDFELIAQNPVARDTVSFDAERAAQILYGWAQKNDRFFKNADYDDETKPDWLARRSNDENLMAGG